MTQPALSSLASIQYREIVVSNDLDDDAHRQVATRRKMPS